MSEDNWKPTDPQQGANLNEIECACRKLDRGSCGKCTGKSVDISKLARELELDNVKLGSRVAAGCQISLGWRLSGSTGSSEVAITKETWV